MLRFLYDEINHASFQTTEPNCNMRKRSFWYVSLDMLGKHTCNKHFHATKYVSPAINITFYCR